MDGWVDPEAHQAGSDETDLELELLYNWRDNMNGIINSIAIFMIGVGLIIFMASTRRIILLLRGHSIKTTKLLLREHEKLKKIEEKFTKIGEQIDKLYT